ncbi:hypothetical protein Tco_0396176 [Tanacetum coccineum]
MIGGLMYLTASRPDIAYSTFVCAHYQAQPTDSGFELIAYSDAEYAGCHDDCKITSGGLQFLGEKLVSWSSKKQDCTAMSTAKAEDDLFLPHKQYGLMDANKKIDLINLQCSNESKILGDILNNHPLQLSLAGSASVPWIYIQQFWHSLKLDDSKDKFKFFVDTKEFTFSVDDIRRIFQLPQATDNNNVGFVAAPSFSHMALFFHNDLGFSLPMHLPSHFVSKGLS